MAIHLCPPLKYLFTYADLTVRWIYWQNLKPKNAITHVGHVNINKISGNTKTLFFFPFQYATDYKMVSLGNNTNGTTIYQKVGTQNCSKHEESDFVFFTFLHDMRRNYCWVHVLKRKLIWSEVFVTVFFFGASNLVVLFGCSKQQSVGRARLDHFLTSFIVNIVVFYFKKCFYYICNA